MGWESKKIRAQFKWIDNSSEKIKKDGLSLWLIIVAYLTNPDD